MRKLMSDTKFYEAYSRYLEDKNRYETWEEAVERVFEMHSTKFSKELKNKKLKKLFNQVKKAYKQKDFLGAQRALQFGGSSILKNNTRIYNCASTYCDRLNAFRETMFALLCGTGMGVSVQFHHIEKLPNLCPLGKESVEYVIDDSIEGWADSVDVLLKSFLDDSSEFFGKHILFDFSKIRPKGAFITGGFKAPGSEPLKKALNLMKELLVREAKTTNRIKPIVAYDLIMYMADAVIAGGVRRSAVIIMFSKTDNEMMTAKTGNWFVENPQRGRSNNSVMLLKDSMTKEELQEIIKSVKEVGEPGFLMVDDLDITLNPCSEIGMYPQTEDGRSGVQFCNLVEINGVKSISKKKFKEQCKMASILGTIQAGYTDFHYFSPETKEIVEREALIGVGITGIMNNPTILADRKILKRGAKVVKKWNKKTASLLGINQAARTTTIKPSGNASVLLECASGIHGEHSKKYIRHIQLNKETEIAKKFMEEKPEMCEQSVWGSSDVVVAFPIENKLKTIYKKDLLGVKQLDYVRLYQTSWIEEGTNIKLCRIPNIRHNVSNTITVDNWDSVSDYIYSNRKELCGVSMLAEIGDKAYPQAPFTEILTEKELIETYGTEVFFTSALIEKALEAFEGNLWNACSCALGFGEKLTKGHKDLLKRDFVRRFDKFSLNFLTKKGKNADKNDKKSMKISENSLKNGRNSLKISEISSIIDAKLKCSNCLKDVYNLHKWWKITSKASSIDWLSLKKKDFTDINTLSAQACSGGQCEIDF